MALIGQEEGQERGRRDEANAATIIHPSMKTIPQHEQLHAHGAVSPFSIREAAKPERRRIGIE